MKFQLTRFKAVFGEEYDLYFPNGPFTQSIDPASPQAKVLNTYFEGLPVLRWMNIVDKATGLDAHAVGGGILPTAARKDKHGNMAGSPGFANAIVALDGAKHTYSSDEAARSLRELAQYVRAHGPFEGAIGFSQGSNLLTVWLALIEAGVLGAAWAAPQWAVLICSTQWGWAEGFDEQAEAFATAIGPENGARTADEVRRLAAEGSLGFEFESGSGGGGSANGPARLERLLTSGPLGIPSMHLIGEKDPSKHFSHAQVQLYADAPSATTPMFARRDRGASGGPAPAPPPSDGEAASSMRLVLEHPNDHMPPRQKDVVERVAAFAARFSGRAREEPVEVA